MHALDVWIEARGAIHRRRLVFASSAEFRARFVYPADLFVALQRYADTLHLDDDDANTENHNAESDDDESGWDMDQRHMYVLDTADARRKRYTRRGAWEMEDGVDDVEDCYAGLGTQLSKLDLGQSAGDPVTGLPGDDDQLCELLLQSHRHPRGWPFPDSNCCYRLDLLTPDQLSSVLQDMETREWNDVLFVRDMTKKGKRKTEDGRMKRDRWQSQVTNSNRSWLGSLVLGISSLSIAAREFH
jgi:hypothetical protein